MKKIKPFFIILSAGLLAVLLFFNIQKWIREREAARALLLKEISVYSVTIADFNSGSMKNNLGGNSGTWELDPADTEQGIEAFLDEEIRMGESGASLRLRYDVDSPDEAVNGFWTQLRTFDASEYDFFEFWAKGDEGEGFTGSFKIEFKKFEKNRTNGNGETVKGSFTVRGITDQWRKVSVPLNLVNGIKDWNDLREFVIIFEKNRVEKKTGILYLDDFTFAHTGRPGPKITDVVEHRIKKTAEDLPPEEFAKFLIARLKGFPEKVFVERVFPENDRAFLMELARDIWGYFDNIVDTEHSLPLDNIEFGGESPISPDTRIGDYTNVTNIGMYLMCVVSAYDLGFITKEDAVKRLKNTLDSMRKLATYNNFPYNYYDITIFQETRNFVSFVDSGWYAVGIIVAKNAFPEEVGKRCQDMLDLMDFSFFYDSDEGAMYHGFHTNIGSFSEYHYGAFYTEPRAISYMVIGKGDVPERHWFRLARTFPENWLWQTQTPKGRKRKECLGYPLEGGYYTYNDVKFVPSWGGSMFEALMPTLIIDEKTLAPRGLGLNNKRHVDIQIEYALEELEYPVFGMSPSSIPGGGYSEYGVTLLGMKGYKSGVVAPYASFLALEFAPEKCVENLRKMLELYDIYGEYGFYDAIDMENGAAVATKYLCLDQAMSLIALNNFLNDGAIRKRFHADPIAKNAEKLLKEEDFFN